MVYQVAYYWITRLNLTAWTAWKPKSLWLCFIVIIFRSVEKIMIWKKGSRGISVVHVRELWFILIPVVRYVTMCVCAVRIMDTVRQATLECGRAPALDTVRLLTHVLCKPTHFFFHSFIATMSYSPQISFNSVTKDWADKYHVWGTPTRSPSRSNSR